MRIAISVLLGVATVAVAALGQPQSLGQKDTIAAAKLSESELRQIIEGVEKSAFDSPDSWTEELRARRVDLGGSPGIVLQGTKLLCGGTGNCQLFVFLKVKNEWVLILGPEQAPMAEAFEFESGVTHGIRDLTLTANSSAESSKRVTYKFDGQRYTRGKAAGK